MSQNVYLPLHYHREMDSSCSSITSLSPLRPVSAQEIEHFKKTMQQISRPSYTLATRQLLIALAFSTSVFATLVLLYRFIPFFVIPIVWILAGVSLSNLLLIAKDCARDNWTASSLLNQVVGMLSMVPLLESFSTFKSLQMSADAVPSTTPLSDNGLPKSLDMLVSRITRLFRPASVTVSSVFETTLCHVFHASCIAYIFVNYGIYGVVNIWLAPLLSYFAVREYVGLYNINFVNASFPSSFVYSLPSYYHRAFSAQLQSAIPTVDTHVPEKLRDLASRTHWIHCIILFGTPIISVYGASMVACSWPVGIWAVVYYFMTGTGITAGYHRLWAHQSYKASWIVQFYLLCVSTGALEGSLKWWCGGHRVHHRYTDTEKDPYNSNGGFFYAHFGWMLVYPKPQNRRKADIRDLNASAMFRFQHKYYLFLGPFMALLFPALVSKLLFDDFLGGLVYAGYIRLFFVHHSTFCVNSVAHYFGEHVYDDERTPRDSIITALLTFGEGYHNFHHEFPNDYRNAIQWYQYDPTKWLINAWYYMGLVTDLRMFPKNEIDMGMISMREKQTAEMKARVVYPKTTDELQTMTLASFHHVCQVEKRSLTIINGIVHDIQPFIKSHPGGEMMINMAIGKDATKMFNGETDIYKHSRAANNLLGQYRIGKIEGYGINANSDNDKNQMKPEYESKSESPSSQPTSPAVVSLRHLPH